MTWIERGSIGGSDPSAIGGVEGAEVARRRRVPPGVIALSIACFFFGLAIAIQLQTETRLRAANDAGSSTDYEAIAADLYDSNTSLRQERDRLISQNPNGGPVALGARQDQTRIELDRLRAFNGQVPVRGPGVVLVIGAQLRSSDLEDLLNEFRNAGAEAIAVGSQRVVYNTPVGQAGSRVTINGTPLDSPLTIRAIGAADVLERALARKGGMVSYLRTSYPRARIVLTTAASLDLPGLTAPP